MFNHNDELLRMYLKSHYDELSQEAERYRLIKEASQSGWREESRTARALAWLGRRMVSWGEHLEKRFESTPSSLVVQPLDLSQDSPCGD
jgi:hypothetical protein